MTTNVKSGNSCQFVAEFVDATGNITIPPAATLNIAYPVGLTTASTSITMALQNSFFTATWNSSVSDLGIATWTITVTGSTVSTGDTLRIITP
jgi:hypothetical protein